MNQPQTPDNGRIKAIAKAESSNARSLTELREKMKPQTPDNEVIDLSPPVEWLYKCDCPQCRVGAHYNKDIADSYRKRGELSNEVARLRELLNRALEVAQTLSGGGSRACRELHHSKKDRHESGDVCPVEERIEKAVSDLAKLKAEARLAPAPEEPVSDWKCPHCGSTTGTWFSRVEPMGDICEDCGKSVDEEPVSEFACSHCEDRKWVAGSVCGECPAPEEHDQAPTQSPTQNEWRELGKDEVICEGDDYQSFSLVGDFWKEVHPWMAGNKADRYPAYSFRTRRPLPNSPESEGIKKQEEMPLERQINYLKENGDGLFADCFRYLRDEIQKLKERTNICLDA